MKGAIYARVSTADQTLEHQRTQAEAAGFKLDRVVAESLSAIRPEDIGREGRPALRAAFVRNSVLGT